MEKVVFVHGCGGRLSRDIFKAFSKKLTRVHPHDFIFVNKMSDGLEMIGVDLLFTDTVFVAWEELSDFAKRKFNVYE